MNFDSFFCKLDEVFCKIYCFLYPFGTYLPNGGERIYRFILNKSLVLIQIIIALILIIGALILFVLHFLASLLLLLYFGGSTGIVYVIKEIILVYILVNLIRTYLL